MSDTATRAQEIADRVSNGLFEEKDREERCGETCACGAPLVDCKDCGDIRCLKCDPYDSNGCTPVPPGEQS